MAETFIIWEYPECSEDEVCLGVWPLVEFKKLPLESKRFMRSICDFEGNILELSGFVAVIISRKDYKLLLALSEAEERNNVQENLG